MELTDKLYKQVVQYSSIKTGIQAHAETYSFNIESELFNQLTKEQQVLWRKELELACISGGEAGVELARDPRYKENHSEVKEEISVEEKAKRYDEAFSRAKDCQFDGLIQSQPVKDVIEYIFFELKEDERIKSCIKTCLANASKQVFDNYNISFSDCLTWLEKQKEQKPITQPVWSEEDEKLYKLSLENLTELMHRFGEEHCSVGDCVIWFESIKDRFFQKYK